MNMHEISNKIIYFFFCCQRFRIHEWCLGCHIACTFLTINSSRKLLSVLAFHILFRYNFLSSGTWSMRLVWCRVFEEVSWIRAQGRSHTTLSDTSSVWNPSRLFSLQGLLVTATLTVLLCFDPGLALNSFLDDQWFCCKRWLMNNNIFSSEVN